MFKLRIADTLITGEDSGRLKCTMNLQSVRRFTAFQRIVSVESTLFLEVENVQKFHVVSALWQFFTP